MVFPCALKCETKMIDGNCTWEEFKERAAELSNKARGSKLLFRGQASAKWDLRTTLERSHHTNQIEDYYETIFKIKTEIQSYTGQSWANGPNDFDLDEIQARLRGGYDSFSRLMTFGSFPHYAYMAYLRHHGFPSPLLDWSASPFVAAYFAFRESREEDVAIFAFRERGPDGMKVGGSDEPAITQLGPYVLGPKRHFAQQSQYTICTRWELNWPYFSNHSEVVRAYDPNAEFQQDVVFKFVLPHSERRKVLNELQMYNLNAFTLFGSEESLMESLAIREE
jgi:FRG domain